MHLIHGHDVKFIGVCRVQWAETAADL